MDQSPKDDNGLPYHSPGLNNVAVTPIHRRIPSRSISGSATPSPAETPSLLSSPSVASSLNLSNGLGSPLRNQLPQHGGSVDGEASIAEATNRAHRFTLARRLSQLAQQLTDGEQVDEAVVSQVDRLEMALVRTPPQQQHHHHFHQDSKQRRPLSLDMRNRGDFGSIFSSPPPSLFRSRFSDLSLSLLRERERERERDDEAEAELRAERDKARRMGMTIQQANRIIAESAKLNEELGQMVENLKARQEESDANRLRPPVKHIHSLLIERAERAAQRILFLQNRISYLEEELQENDDELQHLRICLKAIEVQMPPHPDKDLQRCIAAFKDDYQALKRKRVNRSSLAASITSVDSSVLGSLRTDTSSTQ
ncbi:hypothetical protein HJFPF1_07994 [Paramyrothecium foliicola]|nr:hypothetical protein HJFPF1_07994 [Paramyrothecium foliicola]